MHSILLNIKKLFSDILFKRNNSKIITYRIGKSVCFGFARQRNDMKMFYGLGENKEMNILSQHLCSGDICLDIGANSGCFSALFAQKAAKVYSFDPVPINAKLLELTAIQNQFNNIDIHQCAVYDHCADLVDFIEPSETSLSSIVANDFESHKKHLQNTYSQSSFKSYQVSCISIDSMNLERVDLIKVDTEGAELKVLKGSINTIRRCRPRLLMVEVVEEAMRLHGDSLLELLALMNDINYEPYIIKGSELINYNAFDSKKIHNNNLFFKIKT